MQVELNHRKKTKIFFNCLTLLDINFCSYFLRRYTWPLPCISSLWTLESEIIFDSSNVSDFLDVKLKKHLRATISFFSRAHTRCRKGFNPFDVYIEYTCHENDFFCLMSNILM